jgi:hypothetical protein
MFNVCRDRAAKVPLSGNAARLHGPLKNDERDSPLHSNSWSVRSGVIA